MALTALAPKPATWPPTSNVPEVLGATLTGAAVGTAVAAAAAVGAAVAAGTAVAAGAAAVRPGMASICPAYTMVDFKPLASCSALTVVPNAAAMRDKLSPAFTLYAVAPATGTAVGAAVGAVVGAVLAALPPGNISTWPGTRTVRVSLFKLTSSAEVVPKRFASIIRYSPGITV
ncbi:hypothetical protein EMGBS3_00690 [Anaerolineaceae bacterium]|nr:hypothetical protein EMGBS3_00690 [Anaerolineaceae bacterium]